MHTERINKSLFSHLQQATKTAVTSDFLNCEPDASFLYLCMAYTNLM